MVERRHRAGCLSPVVSDEGTADQREKTEAEEVQTVEAQQAPLPLQTRRALLYHADALKMGGSRV